MNDPLGITDTLGHAAAKPTLFDSFCALVDSIDAALGLGQPPPDLGVHPIVPVRPRPPQLPLREYVGPRPPMSDFELQLWQAQVSLYAVKTMLVTYYEVADYVTQPAQILALGIPESTVRVSGLAFEELGSGSLLDKGLQLEFSSSRAARFMAEDLHYVIPPSKAGEAIAQTKRTTAVIRALDAETGEMVHIFNAYPRTEAIQKALAERMGIEFAPVIEGAHAEGSALTYARSARLIPLEGGVARPICPKCRILIEDVMGGQLVNEKEFILPELVGGR
jgi:hypothetical protein